MITIYWNNDHPEHRFVQIGVTLERIENDKKEGIEHVVIDTTETPATAKLLEAIDEMTNGDADDLEAFLTQIYEMGRVANPNGLPPVPAAGETEDRAGKAEAAGYAPHGT